MIGLQDFKMKSIDDTFLARDSQTPNYDRPYNTMSSFWQFIVLVL
jgi:hypothetical protein